MPNLSFTQLSTFINAVISFLSHYAFPIMETDSFYVGVTNRNINYFSYKVWQI
jgi:hypothetical protein